MTSRLLLTWLSPAFPVGAFAFSGGLEGAVARGLVADAASLADWLNASLAGGTIRTDALAAGLAARGAADDLDALVLALAGSPARERELRALGAAFAEAATPWWPDGLAAPAAYPVAVGTLAHAHGLAAGEVAGAFALAAVTNALAAAQRLLPLGQRAAVRLLAGAEPAIARVADEAERVGTDALFTSTPASDMAALAHPTIEPRLFRS